MSNTTETKIENVPLENIFPSPTNPRKTFDDKALQELADSISEHGLLQPILVRYLPDNFDKNGNENFEIIYGERRFRASKLAGQKTIKAEIRYMEDDEAFEIQVLENLQREDINPLDEARAFSGLMKKETVDWLSSKINKSKKYVLDRIKLLDLCDYAIETLEAGVLPLGHAVLLSKIDKEKQDKIMKGSGVITNIGMGGSKNDYSQSYCTKTLSQLKSYISETMLSFDKVNFDLGDANLIPAVGSCQACPKRTINQNLLFGDITNDDLCTDSFCFNAKLKTQTDNIIEKAKAEFGEVQTGEKEQWSSNGIIIKKERYSFNETETEKYSVPVVINKTTNYDTNNLGRVVWVEDKSKELKLVDDKKSSGPSEWEIKQNKDFDEITIPRFKLILGKAVEGHEAKYEIANLYLLESLVNCELKYLLIVAHILEIKALEIESFEHIKSILNPLDWDQKKELAFNIAKELVETYTTEMLILIISLDEVAGNELDFENDNSDEWEVSLEKIYIHLKLVPEVEITEEVKPSKAKKANSK